MGRGNVSGGFHVHYNFVLGNYVFNIRQFSCVAAPGARPQMGEGT